MTGTDERQHVREIDRAFVLSAESEAVRDQRLFYYLAGDPVLKPMRADPRFERRRQRWRVR